MVDCFGCCFWFVCLCVGFASFVWLIDCCVGDLLSLRFGNLWLLLLVNAAIKDCLFVFGVCDWLVGLLLLFCWFLLVWLFVIVGLAGIVLMVILLFCDVLGVFGISYSLFMFVAFGWLLDWLFYYLIGCLLWFVVLVICFVDLVVVFVLFVLDDCLDWWLIKLFYLLLFVVLLCCVWFW